MADIYAFATYSWSISAREMGSAAAGEERRTKSEGHVPGGFHINVFGIVQKRTVSIGSDS